MDGVVHLFDFGVSQFLPARAYWGVVSQAGQEEFDFCKGETHVGGKADQEDAVQCVSGIPALASDAVWCFENAQVLVITNGRWFEASATGKFPNLQSPPSFLRKRKLLT